MSKQITEENSVEGSNRNRWRKRVMFCLRLVISISLLLAIILFFVPEKDRPQIIAAYADVNFLWLAIAILLTFSDRLVSGWKWFAMLRVREPELKAGSVMQIFFVSTFFGYFLPSSIGGDALRIYSLSRIKGDVVGSTSSVILDRAYGTLGLLLLATIALIPAVGSAMPVADALLIWVLTVGALAGVIIFSSRRCHRWLERTANLEKAGAGKIRRILLKLTTAFTSFVGAKFKLVRIFLLSLSVQVIRVLIVMFLGMSLGINLDPIVYFVYVPIITVITFLPFSIAGIGVREALFVFFFSRPEVGLPTHLCLSLSLLYFSMGIVATIPGAIVYAFTGLGKKKQH